MASKNIFNENELEKRHAGKNAFLKDYAPHEVKRSVLGEVGNKVHRGFKKDDVAQGKEKPTFKHVKARVDCWTAAPSIKLPTNEQKTTTSRKLANAENNTAKIYTSKNVDKIPKVVSVQGAIQKIESSSTSSGEARKIVTRQVARNEKVSSKVNILKIEQFKPALNIKETITYDFNFKLDEEISHSHKLLHHIEDIDINDHDPQLVSEYAADIYKYLYELEESQSINPNFLENHLEVTAKMRAVLIDWLNEVHCQFQLQNETFYMCVGLIDRYLQNTHSTKRKQLQLVGCTALFLASKYEDMYPPNISDFVYITDQTYTEKQIRDMEKSICRALDFKLGRPLPIHFLRRFSKAAGVDGHNHLMSKYFLELLTVDYSMAHYKPSEVAAASLCLTMHLFAKRSTYTKDVWGAKIQHYSTYSLEHLIPIARKIAKLVKDAPNAKLKAVYSKYSSSKFEKISTRQVLVDSIINKLSD